MKGVNMSKNNFYVTSIVLAICRCDTPCFATAIILPFWTSDNPHTWHLF